MGFCLGLAREARGQLEFIGCFDLRRNFYKTVLSIFTAIYCSLLSASNASVYKQPPNKIGYPDDAEVFIQGFEIEDKYSKGLFSGLSAAFLWANVMSELKTNHSLYCPPMDLVIDDYHLYMLTRDYIYSNPSIKSKPIGFIALTALAEKYSCK